MDRAFPYGVDETTGQLLMERIRSGGPDSKIGNRFVGIHGSPILIEVALFLGWAPWQQSWDTSKTSSRHIDLEALGLAARRALTYVRPWAAGACRHLHRRCRDLAQFDEPLPEAPVDPLCVLDPARPGQVHPPRWRRRAGGYFGFMNGAALRLSVAATSITSAWDQNAGAAGDGLDGASTGGCGARVGAQHVGPSLGMRRIKSTVQAMAKVSTGLAAARHGLLERSGWDVENDEAWTEAPRLTVVVGEEVHASGVEGARAA